MDHEKKLKEIAEKRQQLQTNFQQAEQVLKNCQAELYYLQGKEYLIKEMMPKEETVTEPLHG